MSGPHCVAFDLGSSNSVCAVYRQGNVEFVPDDTGSFTVPSIVSFTDTEILVGATAKSQLYTNPTNTIYLCKKFMGKSFSSLPKETIDEFPYKILNDGKDNVVFEVEYKKETKKYYPEEISALILNKLKSMAMGYLGIDKLNNGVVVTIPAYYSESGKQAVERAIKISGMDTLRLLAEPSSAALAYGQNNKNVGSDEKNIIVIDCGDSTHDVSLLNTFENVYEVLAITGTNNLAGSNITNKIVEYIKGEFKKKNKNDITNPKSLAKITRSAENAKKTLTSSSQAVIDIENLEGVDFQCNLSRAKFESLCDTIFRDLVSYIEPCIADGNLKKNDINEVVLAGGSTRIPKLQQMVSEIFNGRKLNKTIDPDLAIAQGACIQSALILGIDDENTKDLLLIDTTSIPLGIKVNGFGMQVLIDKNENIPVSRTQIFSTQKHNQTTVTIEVFEGFRPVADENKKLGEFQLNNIPPMPQGQPQIEVSFSLDANGILEVSAKELSTNNKNKIEINKKDKVFSDEEITRLMEECKLYEEQDRLRVENVNTRNRLESLAYSKEHTETLEWLENNPVASTDEYIERIAMLEQEE